MLSTRDIRAAPTRTPSAPLKAARSRTATTRALRPRRAGEALLVSLVLAVTGCGREEIVHGLEEVQANQVIVALDEGGVRGEKRRDDGAEGTWRVDVAPPDATRAQRILAERELPRPRPPGFGEVFGKGSVVPTASEERALYLHALSGELARSVEAIDGVVEARVHLALRPQDALRPEAAAPPRGAVLVKVRPGARSRIEPLADGIRSLVAGAVAGLDSAAVAVVIADASPAAPPPPAAGIRPRAPLLVAAAVATALALALLAAPVRGRLKLPRWARLRRGTPA